MGFTFEEVTGDQDQGAPQSALKSFRFEEGKPAPVPSSTPEEKAKAPLAKDVAMSAGAGLLKGAAGVLGAPGDIQQITDTLAEKGKELLPENVKWLADVARYTQPFGGFGAALQDLGVAPQLPTTEDVVSAGEKLTGYDLYEPQTETGRYTRAATEFVPGMFAGPAGGISKTGRVLTGLASGLTSEAAGRLTEGTPFEPYARFAGAILPGIPAATLEGAIKGRSKEFAQRQGENIAARIAQQAVPSPADTATRIAANQQLPLVPGLEPTTAQMAGSRALQELEGRVYGQGRGDLGQSSAAIQLQRQQSQQALQDAAAAAARARGASIPVTTLNIPLPTDPMNQASRQAYFLLDASEQAAKAAERAEWQNVSAAGADLKKNTILGQLQKYLDEMEVSEGLGFPKAKYQQAIADMDAQYAGQIPISEIQNFRSAVLRDARNTAEAVNSRKLNEFSGRLFDLLEDPQNYTFGNQAAAAQWQRAVRASREYHNTYDQLDELFGLRGVDWKSSPEAALGRILGSKNAADNLRKLRSITDVDLDDSVRQYMLGDLTKNGARPLPTAEEVRNFALNAKNAAIIDEVPGLRSQFTQIANDAARMTQAERSTLLNQRFAEVAGSNRPGDLSRFIGQNKNELLQGQSANVRNYIDALENSGKLLSKLDNTNLVGEDALNILAQGDIMTLLVGKTTGHLLQGAGGGVLGYLATKVPGLNTISEPLGAAAGAAASRSGAFKQSMSRLFFGSTEDEARALLDEAMRNPAVMQRLLQKPTPENINLVLELGKRLARPAGYAAMQQARPEEPTTIDVGTGRVLPETGSRTGFARGGAKRLLPASASKKRVDADAKALVSAAAKAKKKIDGHTENILNMPDEAVVTALRVAKADTRSVV